jgi:hypothetical protein
MKKIFILFLSCILSIGIYAKEYNPQSPVPTVSCILDSLGSGNQTAAYIIQTDNRLAAFEAYLQLRAKYPRIGDETRKYNGDVIITCLYPFENGTITYYDSVSRDITGVLEINCSGKIDKSDPLKRYPEHFFILFLNGQAKK